MSKVLQVFILTREDDRCPFVAVRRLTKEFVSQYAKRTLRKMSSDMKVIIIKAFMFDSTGPSLKY